MLLSQKIASSNNFLKSMVKKPMVPLIEIKASIINSMKFLVGEDVINFHDPDVIMGVMTKYQNEHDRYERSALYHEYGKLPYDCMLFENESGAMLVQRHPLNKETYFQQKLREDGHVVPKGQKHDVLITLIDSSGLVLPFNLSLAIESSDPEYGRKNLIPCEIGGYNNYEELLATSALFDHTGADGKSFNFGDFILLIGNIQIGFGAALYEMLLFMNATNTAIVKYRPSKKELGKTPKVLHPKYEYHILDIYREKPRYENIEEVKEFLSNRGEKQNRRAHLVRGHFKRKNGKLFWWNAFLRNRKNIDSMGVVDKDYQLVK